MRSAVLILFPFVLFLITWSRGFFGDGMTGAHALPNSTKENNDDLLITKNES